MDLRQVSQELVEVRITHDLRAGMTGLYVSALV